MRLCLWALWAVGAFCWWGTPAIASPASDAKVTTKDATPSGERRKARRQTPKALSLAAEWSTRRWLSAGWLSQTEFKSEPLQPGQVKPPMEWPLIMLQFFSGAVVASFGGVLLQSIVDITIQNTNPTMPGEERIQLSSNIGTPVLLATLPWIVALTVWGIGKLSNNYYGNYWWTLLGAFAGQLLAFGTSLLLTAIDGTADKVIARITGYVLNGALCGLGAVIFYNLFRKPHQGIQQLGGLLQYRDGRWAMGAPLPQFAVGPQSVQITLPLMRGTF